jgi:hypothetical protein
MEKDWIKIFDTTSPFEAELIKGMLLENGVNAVLLNRQDSSYLQALPGQAEVYVHVSQEAQALELINEGRSTTKQ